jgi:streptogramin lyase
VYIVQNNSPNVVEFDPTGRLLAEYAVPGAKNLSSVWVDARGSLYVFDQTITQVIKLSR